MLRSPPSRRRGLKSIYSGSHLELSCRLLRGGVDWNPFQPLLGPMHRCRLLRGGVDWNIHPATRYRFVYVASFAEAWIEICPSRLVGGWADCRLLRGGVDWNTFDGTTDSARKSRLLRGGVDWNMEPLTCCCNVYVASFAEAWIEIEGCSIFERRNGSPPSRRRGLKLRSVCLGIFLLVSPPSRRRGLKFF